MNLLHRYILREILLFFSISLLAFTGILLTLRMVRFASLVIDRGVALSQVAQVFIAIVPTFLEFAVPLAALLAVMLAFARLSGDSELVVMRSSGISLFQLAPSVVFFGVAAAMCALWLSQQAKPWGYRKLSKTLYEIARARSTAGLEQGVFNKLGLITIYAEEIEHSSGKLRHVLVDDRRGAEARKVAISNRGTIVSDDSQKTIIITLQDGVVHETLNGRYNLTSFNTNSLILSPDELFSGGKQADVSLNELSRKELYGLLDFMSAHAPQEAALPAAAENPRLDFAGPALPDVPAPEPLVLPSGLNARDMLPTNFERRRIRIRTELAQRVALPMASFCLALLALPLGIHPARQQRSWGAGLSIALGLIVFTVYYGLFSIGLVLSQNGIVNPELAVWIPNLVTLCIAAYLLWKTATEQWISVAMALEDFILRAIKLPYSKFFALGSSK